MEVLPPQPGRVSKTVTRTSTPWKPRSTKSPLKTYLLVSDGSPLWFIRCTRSASCPWMSPTCTTRMTYDYNSFGKGSELLGPLSPQKKHHVGVPSDYCLGLCPNQSEPNTPMSKSIKSCLSHAHVHVSCVSCALLTSCPRS